MGTRVKAWNVFSRIVFLLAFAASAGVFYLTRTGEGYIDLIINLAFDVVAAIFIIIYFEGCARPLARVTAALARVTDSIRGTRGDPDSLWDAYGKDGIFSNRRLDERYRSYLREVRRLQQQNALTANCPIDDYIDEELVYATVSKSFCDQIAGIMTGLGILFTFIGLVYGLRNFDASSVDVMQTSTQALMAGIKIAFLTSIFGLIYSLLFGLSYKKLLKHSVQALYDFQDVYTERVRPSNEHAAENAMLRLQTEQNAALERFGSSVGEQVSESLITLMRPTVDTLQRTITQYVTVAIEDQRAGMEKVVRYFLDSMNTSLGNIFVQLKERTEELTQWEKDMTDAIRVMLEGIGHTGQALTQAQAKAAQITDAMAAYTETMESLTAAQADVVRDMAQLIAAYDERREQENALLRATADSAQTVAGNMDQSFQVAQSIRDMAQDVNEAGLDSARKLTMASEQIADAVQAIQNVAGIVTTNISAAADRLGQAAGELEGGMSRSVSDSLSLMDESLARLNDSLTTVAVSMNNVTRTVNDLPKTVTAVDGDIKTSAKAIDTELKLLLKAVSDTQKILSRFNADLERRTRS